MNAENPKAMPAIADGRMQNIPINSANTKGMPTTENAPTAAPAPVLVRMPMMKKPIPIINPYKATAPTVSTIAVIKNRRLSRAIPLAWLLNIFGT
jgi:hypothetical protein